jgi:kynurenine formamidase
MAGHLRYEALALLTGLLVSACTPAPSPPPADSSSSSVEFPIGPLVDLSHPFDERTIVWPTSEHFRLEKVADGVTEGGYYYAANNFFSAEHGGTHIDAPIHFAKGRRTVDQIPLDQLTGAAVVVDVSAAATKDADYQISTADFEQWEREHGRIPDRTIVLFRTGFSKRWPDAQQYLGTSERGAAGVAKLHFPGLHPDGARWLVENRSIDAVGIDTASIDRGQSTQYESHRILTDRDIPAFENLANLDRLPEVGAYIVALPMKIGGGSGGPLRAMAILPR